MSATTKPGDRFLRQLVGVYITLLALAAVLAPSALTLYLFYYPTSPDVWVAHHFHEVVIGIAIALSALICLVTFKCFLLARKQFQFWLLLGLIAFTIIYAPHGFLTSAAHDNIWLFILYGPVSRVVMACCFLSAALQLGREVRIGNRLVATVLLIWVAICIAIAIATAALATSPIASHPYLRWLLEGIAVTTFLCAIGVIAIRRIRSYIISIFTVCLLLFAQSSIAFLLASAWSHLWWYAHLIFAAGFGLLSYGIALSFRNTGNFEDLFSQEELLDRLRVANDKYQASNTDLTNFAHMVSHDLQAPLRQLSTYIDLLQEDQSISNNNESAQYLRLIDDGASHMRALVRAILNLSAVDKSRLNLVPLDLNQLMNEVIALFEKDCLNSDIHINTGKLPNVLADKVLLFQVFQNLIQNAIKYRKAQGALMIDITARRDAPYWRIDVADNGIGFSDADKEKAMSMFGRLHAEGISGTGAGLAICKKILERHDGYLNVRAKINVGATFMIYLPDTKN